MDNPLQKLVDSMNESALIERARYHLTFGAVIEKATAIFRSQGNITIVFDVGGSPGLCRSYRGYYSDLAFAHKIEETDIEAFLLMCRGALGHTFEGYKGGDNVMQERTPLWVSEWGEASGIAITDLTFVGHVAMLFTRQTD